MHDRIRSHFAGLITAITKTTLPGERQAYVATAIGKLEGLYSSFRETNASRCGDQIAIIVDSVLRELEACPAARQLEPEFRSRLHLLHEELGIPKLGLKPAPAARKKPQRAK
jgi:hypothetical protein